MSQWPEVFVLRHGQTHWNVEGRLQGHLDSPLTDLGREQARRQGEILSDILTMPIQTLCSPVGRAWETARLAGLSPQAEPALAELGLGEWQGLSVDAVKATLTEISHKDSIHLWKFSAPGGETVNQMQERLRDFLCRLNKPAILVTHGVTSRMLRCLLLGRPVEDMETLPGGQGVVHHLKGGWAEVLR